jgi:hypothetical protein
MWAAVIGACMASDVRAASRQLDNGRGELRLALSQIADVAGWLERWQSYDVTWLDGCDIGLLIKRAAKSMRSEAVRCNAIALRSGKCKS